jgi:hypothetical protein
MVKQRFAQLTKGKPFHDIRSLNQLPQEAREQLYSLLVPAQACDTFGIDRSSFTNPAGEKVLNVEADPRTPYALVELREKPGDRDCIFYLELEDTSFGKFEVSFLIINDPRAPRFDTDVDTEGRRTKFATVRRNLPEEVRAMQAGLAPGQVRKGLRLLDDFLSLVQDFAGSLGQDMIISEPLTYNAAIIFESDGFNYMRGRRRMDEINRGFQPGGELFQKLDGSTPFRQPGMEKTVRGRSWAIHDGILGEPWRGVEMYLLPRPAGISTFPGGAY